jgi:hypothetical protein
VCSACAVSGVLLLPLNGSCTSRVSVLDPFSRYNMSDSQSDSILRSVSIRWNPKILTTSLLALSAIALVCLIAYLEWNRSKVGKEKPAAPQAQVSEAELKSATGMVLVRKPGRIEWREVKTGAFLTQGDLIRTDNTGNAVIRYSNGATVSIQAKTVFTVQAAGSNEMEISAPPIGAESEKEASKPGAGARGTALGETAAGGLRPSIELQRLVPFGRSLELIGKVEAGSSLAVNDESVEVDGNGFFKHFTNPFPASAGEVHLVMKVTDLSGRIRTLTATYDFSPHGRGR